MKLSCEEIEHIALLCRLKLTDTEREKMREQLSNILENFEVLQQVDTTDVPPTAQSIELQNVFREDKASPSLTQTEVLKNAPREEDSYFRVRAVLNDEGRNHSGTL